MAHTPKGIGCQRPTLSMAYAPNGLLSQRPMLPTSNGLIYFYCTAISSTSIILITELSLDDAYENESAENTNLNNDKEFEYEDSFIHHDYPEHQEDDKMIDSNSTDGRSDMPIYDEYVEALAIEVEDQAGVIISNLIENI